MDYSDYLDIEIMASRMGRTPTQFLNGKPKIGITYGEKQYKYFHSEKGKEAQKRYNQTEKGKERWRRYYQKKKLRMKYKELEQ